MIADLKSTADLSIVLAKFMVDTSNASKQPYFTLNSGHKIPAIGLGTFQAENGKLSEVIKKAILVDGYRHIDCAKLYGNEEEIGEAL
jgi:diketogulonate reductase-like aldo/keto reductase